MSENVITPDMMWNYFTNGAVGTKEFRNWLAKVDPIFAEVRDPDVDNEIDRIARERAAATDEESGENPGNR